MWWWHRFSVLGVRVFTGQTLGLLIGMYFATAVGITVGFHRLFVHRSFETPLALKFVFAVLGSMAVQGSLRKWVAMHRRHHQTSDTPDDPHSPHHHGSGVRGVLQGLWHSHMGWFFTAPPPHLDRYLHDINGSAALRVASVLFPLWVALGLAIPAILGGLLTHSWTGMWTGLIWGGLVRIFLVHHITWSINSVCHLWGSRPYRSLRIKARNNFCVRRPGQLGEGWHATRITRSRAQSVTAFAGGRSTRATGSCACSHSWVSPGI